MQFYNRKYSSNAKTPQNSDQSLPVLWDLSFKPPHHRFKLAISSRASACTVSAPILASLTVHCLFSFACFTHKTVSPPDMRTLLSPHCAIQYLTLQYLIHFFQFLNDFIFFYWSMVDLQCCVNFCCTAKWLSYTYKYILFSDSFPLWFITGYWI